MTPGAIVRVQPRRMHSGSPWHGVVVQPDASGAVRTGSHVDELGVEYVRRDWIAVRPLHPERGYSRRPVVVPIDIVTVVVT